MATVFTRQTMVQWHCSKEWPAIVALTSCTHNVADKTDSIETAVTKTTHLYLNARIFKFLERMEARISENKCGGTFDDSYFRYDSFTNT